MSVYFGGGGRGKAPEAVTWTLGHKDRPGKREVARVSLEPAISCKLQVLFF